MSEEPTPGPWDVVDEALIATEGYPDSGEWVIAELRHAHKKNQHETAMANARLMAAAPDLRDALEEVRPLIWHYTKDGEHIEYRCSRCTIEDALEAAGVNP